MALQVNVIIDLYKIKIKEFNDKTRPDNTTYADTLTVCMKAEYDNGSSTLRTV